MNGTLAPNTNILIIIYNLQKIKHTHLTVHPQHVRLVQRKGPWGRGVGIVVGLFGLREEGGVESTRGEGGGAGFEGL
jgi:hypothetical protein